MTKPTHVLVPVHTHTTHMMRFLYTLPSVGRAQCSRASALPLGKVHHVVVMSTEHKELFDKATETGACMLEKDG